MTASALQSSHMHRTAAWGGFVLLLALAPLAFSGGTALTLLSQMGVTMILCLSYNLLLGQAGMLSFGHAVYSGLGAFCAVHAMNAAGAGRLWMPVSLVPLVGGLAGLGFGTVFGYLSTRRAGTTFAMITLGIGELVFASSLMLPQFFGGEGGFTTNRVIGEPFLGISFGPQIQVYYLIAAWLFISAAAMFAFTRTPLGRMANAVRDNPDRAAFVGYDPQRVRHLVLMVSAFFAGISGGLSAINLEMVSAENLSTLRSGQVLLFTVIGGGAYFFGPMIGAVVGVFLTAALSMYTKAWQLYLGLFFCGIVMFAPGGLSHLAMTWARSWSLRQLPLYAAGLVAASAMIAGIVLAIEMTYHLSLDEASGMTMIRFGQDIDVSQRAPWMAALILAVTGGAMLYRLRCAGASRSSR